MAISAQPREKRLADTLAFIGSYIHENGFPPTVREIVATVGQASTSIAANDLRTLIGRGLLEKQANLSRALRLTPDGWAIARQA